MRASRYLELAEVDRMGRIAPAATVLDGMSGLARWATIAGYRACDRCTLCCKLPAISDPALTKAADTLCRYCEAGKGCTIQEAKPDSCRAFQCLWSQLPGQGDPLPEHWRPDLVNGYLIRSADGSSLHVVTDPSTPDAWREGEFGDALKALAVKNDPPVLVQIGQRFLWLRGVGGELQEIEGAVTLEANGRIMNVAFRP